MLIQYVSGRSSSTPKSGSGSVESWYAMNAPPSGRRPTPPSPVGRFLCALVALLLGLGQATDALELELLAALPIRGLENAQPSGLTMAGGVLFAVSDKHDHAICRIDIRDDGARLEPFITFIAPWSGRSAEALTLGFRV